MIQGQCNRLSRDSRQELPSLRQPADNVHGISWAQSVSLCCLVGLQTEQDILNWKLFVHLVFKSGQFVLLSRLVWMSVAWSFVTPTKTLLNKGNWEINNSEKISHYRYFHTTIEVLMKLINHNVSGTDGSICLLSLYFLRINIHTNNLKYRLWILLETTKYIFLEIQNMMMLNDHS